MLTTYDSIEAIKSVKRWDKKSTHVDVHCPPAIVNYNKHTGGVDLLDAFLSYYHIHVQSKKMVSLVIVALVQGWVFP